MNDFFEVAIAVLVLLDMAALYYKGIIRKDWGIIGTLAPMVFLVAAIIYDLSIESIGSDYFHIGIFLVMLGNFISNLFIITSKRFKAEIQAAHILDLLKDLQEKYSFVVDNAPVGIYVLNKLGRFEFVNKSFCILTGYTEEELLKMTIYDVLPNDILPEIKQKLMERISNIIPKADYQARILTKSGIIKKVRVTAKRTENGHATVTGSLTLLEE